MATSKVQQGPKGFETEIGYATFTTVGATTTLTTALSEVYDARFTPTNGTSDVTAVTLYPLNAVSSAAVSGSHVYAIDTSAGSLTVKRSATTDSGLGFFYQLTGAS